MVQSAQIQFRYDSKDVGQRWPDDALFHQLPVDVRGVNECHRNETTEMRSMQLDDNTAIPFDHVGCIDAEFLYVSVCHVVPGSIQSCTIDIGR